MKRLEQQAIAVRAHHARQMMSDGAERGDEEIDLLRPEPRLRRPQRRHDQQRRTDDQEKIAKRVDDPRRAARRSIRCRPGRGPSTRSGRGRPGWRFRRLMRALVPADLHGCAPSCSGRDWRRRRPRGAPHDRAASRSRGSPGTACRHGAPRPRRHSAPIGRTRNRARRTPSVPPSAKRVGSSRSSSEPDSFPSTNSSVCPRAV